jgi:hypothetical protein
MAKHEYHGVREVESLPVKDWMPLGDILQRLCEAPPKWKFDIPIVQHLWEKIKHSVRAAERAAAELTAHAYDGDLTVAARKITPAGVPDNCFVFTSQFWQHYKASRIDRDGKLISDCALLQQGRWTFFGTRANLPKLYPPEFESAPAQSNPAVSEKPQRRRGRKPKHDWISIAIEIARRCYEDGPPDNEREFTRGILAWCEEKFDDEPSESDVRAMVKRVCDALKN